MVPKDMGESATGNLGKPAVLLNDEWTGHKTVYVAECRVTIVSL